MSEKSREPQELFVDFGVRKAHAVLIGNSRAASYVRDLRDLGLSNRTIYIEDGYPRQEVHALASTNQVFSIDGRFVHGVREARAIPKSDENDVFLIRDLARTARHLFRRVSPRTNGQNEERMAYDYYCQLTDLIVSLKNRRKAFERNCGRFPSQLAEALHSLEIEKEISRMVFQKYTPAARHVGIKGLGVRYLGGILVMAHPKRFRSLSAYLAYCGYKESSKRLHKYNHHVAALYHQLSSSVIMHRDVTFYSLYLKLKEDLGKRFPTYRRGKIDGMARNRLSTFLAKEIFGQFSGQNKEVQSPPNDAPSIEPARSGSSACSEDISAGVS